MLNTKITKPEEAFELCINIAESIENIQLQHVARKVLLDNKKNFLRIKGSNWQHHNYPGGLIVHTCNVTLISIYIANFYGGRISTDLVKFASLLHDVGKLFDYNMNDSFQERQNPSINQLLLGHCYEGARYIEQELQDEYTKNPDAECRADEVITQCIHCIGAHMENWYGAVSHHHMFEVLIIGKADCIDAYLEQTILDEDETGMFTLGTGDVFYRCQLK